MHPSDQTSIAALYWLASKISSGARYQRVTTCLVSNDGAYSSGRVSEGCTTYAMNCAPCSAAKQGLGWGG
jgi:hypothetical protein